MAITNSRNKNEGGGRIKGREIETTNRVSDRQSLQKDEGDGDDNVDKDAAARERERRALEDTAAAESCVFVFFVRVWRAAAAAAAGELSAAAAAADFLLCAPPPATAHVCAERANRRARLASGRLETHRQTHRLDAAARVRSVRLRRRQSHANARGNFAAARRQVWRSRLARSGRRRREAHEQQQSAPPWRLQLYLCPGGASARSAQVQMTISALCGAPAATASPSGRATRGAAPSGSSLRRKQRLAGNAFT